MDECFMHARDVYREEKKAHESTQKKMAILMEQVT